MIRILALESFCKEFDTGDAPPDRPGPIADKHQDTNSDDVVTGDAVVSI